MCWTIGNIASVWTLWVQSPHGAPTISLLLCGIHTCTFSCTITSKLKQQICIHMAWHRLYKNSYSKYEYTAYIYFICDIKQTHHDTPVLRPEYSRNSNTMTADALVPCIARPLVATLCRINRSLSSTRNIVRCRYSKVYFLSNPHKIHPIAHPSGRAMGYNLWFDTDLYFASVNAVPYEISCYIGPCYNR